MKRILPPLIFLLATVGVYAADNNEFVIGQLAYRVLSEENHEVVVYTDDQSIHGEIEIRGRFMNRPYTVSYEKTVPSYYFKISFLKPQKFTNYL